jgi:hypothetical protein
MGGTEGTNLKKCTCSSSFVSTNSH